MLSESGVFPDVIVCRTEEPLTTDIKRKIALFCNVKQEAVIEAPDASTIYEVPLLMMNERLGFNRSEKIEYNFIMKSQILLAGKVFG